MSDETTPGLAERGLLLVRWARARVREQLGGAAAVRPEGAWCEEPGATFVTIRWPDDSLQGCIGSIEPRRGIVFDVAHNAVAAALHDPRSEPIELGDVDRLHFELSILSPLERVEFTDEASAHAAIRQGLDGIVLEWGGRRATFLPSMWPVLGDVRTFLRELRRKAGLSSDFWADDVVLRRYTTDRFSDPATDP